MSSSDKDRDAINLPRYEADGEIPRSGERFLIPGPTGDIEAELSGKERRPDAPIAVVCHPHPLHGGSLTNKVVHTVARAFNDLGVLTLRFNFRGVGHSQGQFAQGIGEAEDLASVVHWFKHRHPNAPLWLAGFSFGAAVAYRAQESLHPQRLLLVAPPVTQDYFPADVTLLAEGSLSAEGSFPAETQSDCRWMVVQGSEDEVIAAEAVTRWVQQQENPPEYYCLADAGHFFHGRLIEVRERIKQAWGSPPPD